MSNAEIIRQIINDLEFEKARLQKSRNRFECMTKQRDIKQLDDYIFWLKGLQVEYGKSAV